MNSTKVIEHMRWCLGAIALFIVGLGLRRLLRLGQSSVRSPERYPPLSPEREMLYRRVTRELETQTTILAISLNDALQERDAHHHPIAWRLVQLSVSEWRRAAETTEALLDTLSKYLLGMEGVALHSIVARRFKSPLMIDQVRLYELLDQLVFRSKLRFQLQIRLLRRALEALTTEFRHTFRELDETREQSADAWGRLDILFYDFDLVTKETLLALRALLVCLPQSNLSELAVTLEAVVEHGVCSPKVQQNPYGRINRT